MYIYNKKKGKQMSVLFEPREKEIKKPAFCFTKAALPKSLTILNRVYFSHTQK